MSGSWQDFLPCASGCQARIFTSHRSIMSGSSLNEGRTVFSMAANDHIPLDRRERFSEVAALIEQFDQQHLDPELTSFAIELWKRVPAQEYGLHAGQSRG